MGPRFLALLVASLLLGLSALLALRSIVALRQAPDVPALDERKAQDHRWQRSLAVLLLLALYAVFLWLQVPYVPATACFIMAAAFVLDSRQLTRGRRLRAAATDHGDGQFPRSGFADRHVCRWRERSDGCESASKWDPVEFRSI